MSSLALSRPVRHYMRHVQSFFNSNISNVNWVNTTKQSALLKLSGLAETNSTRLWAGGPSYVSKSQTCSQSTACAWP